MSNKDFTQKVVLPPHLTKNLKGSTLLKRARNCQNPNKTQLKEPSASKVNLITIYSPEEEFTADTIINLRSLICTPQYKSQQKFNILDKVYCFPNTAYHRSHNCATTTSYLIPTQRKSGLMIRNQTWIQKLIECRLL